MGRTRERHREREGSREKDKAASCECSNEPGRDREDEEVGRKGGALTRRQ